LFSDCARHAHRGERRSCNRSKRIWHVHLSVILPAAVALIYIRFQEAASASRHALPSSAHFVASDAPTNAEKRLAVGE
jgi:hypothetical protein